MNVRLQCAALTLLAPLAPAQIRSSANYSIAAETAGVTSGSASSANYKQVSEAGAESAVSGTATAGGTAYVAKHGFTGQLYDVQSVSFTPPQAGLPESGALPLQPRALMTDGTLLTDPRPFRYVTDRPDISSVSTGGLLTLGIYYDDVVIPVRASLDTASGTMQVTLLDRQPDNWGSYAGDGLPDWWQVEKFGVGNPLAAPGADPDGDTWSNHFEYFASLEPLLAASRFQMNFRLNGNTGEITYGPVMPGSSYKVEWSTDFVTWTLLSGETPVDAGGFRTEFDPDAVTEGTRRFYRVLVSRP